MQIATGFKRAWLRRQVQIANAASPAITIKAQLETQLETLVDAVTTGQAISSTSGNGHSVSFSEPGKGAPGPGAMAALVDEMLRRHDEAAEALGIGTPTAANNAAILAQMLAHLWPVREVRNNFSSLRVANAA